MNPSETNSNHNGFKPLEKILPLLQAGNELEVQVTQETKKGSKKRVLRTRVVAIEQGATLGHGAHSRRDIIVSPPLDPSPTGSEETQQKIWLEDAAAQANQENSMRAYPKTRIAEKSPSIKNH